VAAVNRGAKKVLAEQGWGAFALPFGEVAVQYLDLYRQLSASHAAQNAAAGSQVSTISRADEGNLIVIEELRLPEPKTKEAVKLLESLNVTGTALLVTHEEQPEFMRAVRNIPGITFMKVDSLNVYDVLVADKVIITKPAVAKIEEVLGNA